MLLLPLLAKTKDTMQLEWTATCTTLEPDTVGQARRAQKNTDTYSVDSCPIYSGNILTPKHEYELLV